MMHFPRSAFALILIAAPALASKDTSKVDEVEPVTAAELATKFEIQGDIFYLTPDGKRLIDHGPQRKIWRPRAALLAGKPAADATVQSQWSSGNARFGEFALKHAWKVLPDGGVQVDIEEFATVVDKKGYDTEFRDSLGKESYRLENFAPVSWVSRRPGAKVRIVARLTPVIRDQSPIQKLAELPIAGEDLVVTDNEGHLWLEKGSISGQYVGFTTHRGSLFLSFAPFAGAHEIGLAEGNRIEVSIGGTRVASVLSRTPFLPADLRAKVYGFYKPGQKTERLSSVHYRSSSQESGFLESIARGER